jgi:hypothetical protein
MEICQNGNNSIAIQFIETVASYKNESAARILSAILNGKPNISCAQRDIYLKRDLINDIRENDCPAFSELNKQLNARPTQ